MRVAMDLYIVQEAIKFFQEGMPGPIRLALILLDNAAELAMINWIEEDLEILLEMNEFTPTLASEKRHRLHNGFKEKTDYLLTKQVLSDDEQALFLLGHALRNSFYHTGFGEDKLTLPIFVHYLDVLTRVDSTDSGLIPYEKAQSFVKTLLPNYPHASLVEAIRNNILERVSSIFRSLALDMTSDPDFNGLSDEDYQNDLERLAYFYREDILQKHWGAKKDVKQYFEQNKSSRDIAALSDIVNIRFLRAWQTQAIQIKNFKDLVHLWINADKELIAYEKIVDVVDEIS